MKLSKTQLEALRKLKEGKFIYYGHTPYPHYFSINGITPHFLVDDVNKLVELELARDVYKGGIASPEVTITEKGIRFLEEF